MSFPSNESLDLLKMIGVKYVVIHTKEMDVAQWNHTNSTIKDYPDEVRLRKNFGDDYVYEINTTSSNYALRNTRIYGTTGFYAYENWQGIPTRWMQADGTINVLSPDNRTRNMTMQVLSFHVSVPLHHAKGANNMRLHMPEGCERPSDTDGQNNLDTRCLSVAVQNITIS